MALEHHARMRITMAYGTVAGVAALSKVWTKNGEYTAYDLYGNCTNPTFEQVEIWLAEVSGVLDLAFANNGFVTPVIAVDVLPSMNSYVQALVSDLCHAANSSGRFFTDKFIERGGTPMMAIIKDVDNWVAGKSSGLDAMGVPRIPDFSGKNTAIIEVI